MRYNMQFGYNMFSNEQLDSWLRFDSYSKYDWCWYEHLVSSMNVYKDLEYSMRVNEHVDHITFFVNISNAIITSMNNCCDSVPNEHYKCSMHKCKLLNIQLKIQNIKPYMQSLRTNIFRRGTHIVSINHISTLKKTLHSNSMRKSRNMARRCRTWSRTRNNLERKCREVVYCNFMRKLTNL